MGAPLIAVFDEWVIQKVSSIIRRVPASLTEVLTAEICPSQQVVETRIIAQRIEKWMDLQPLQEVRFFFVSLFQPDKCLLIVAEPQVRVYERGSRNIAFLDRKSVV